MTDPAAQITAGPGAAFIDLGGPVFSRIRELIAAGGALRLHLAGGLDPRRHAELCQLLARYDAALVAAIRDTAELELAITPAAGAPQ